MALGRKRTSHKESDGIAWPSLRRGLEAAKWQAWIGHGLAQWRANATANLKQKSRASLVGLAHDVLSRIETGNRRVDAVEIIALAKSYHKTPDAIAELFEAPTVEQWDDLRRSRKPDDRFRTPHRTRPDLQTIKQPPTK